MQPSLNIYRASSWPHKLSAPLPLQLQLPMPPMLLLAAARVYWKSTCRHTEPSDGGSRPLTSAILDELNCVLGLNSRR